MTRPGLVPRLLVAFALLGGAVVNLGLVRGTWAGPQAIVSLAAGVLELGGAFWVLRATREPGPVLVRAAVATLAVLSVAGLVLALAPGGHFGAAPASAAGLQLGAAVVLGAATRPSAAGPEGPRSAGTRRPGRPSAAPALALLFVGAVAVSAAATAGLTDTAAGASAVPHSEHHLPDLSGLELHHHTP